MANVGALATIASVIAGFGAAMLVFRIQPAQDQLHWIPWADRLLVAATLISLLLVLLPLTAGGNRLGICAQLPAAACAAAVTLMAGYVLALLAHYRLILGRGRSGVRSNPEPAERWLVFIAIAAAFVLFLITLLRYRFLTEL